MRVSPTAARSMVVLAPISTSSSMTTVPTCGILSWRPSASAREAEAVAADHGAVLHDHAIADHDALADRHVRVQQAVGADDGAGADRDVASRTMPAPMRAPAPIATNGPMEAPGSTTASAATEASGLIPGDRPRRRRGTARAPGRRRGRGSSLAAAAAPAPARPRRRSPHRPASSRHRPCNADARTARSRRPARWRDRRHPRWSRHRRAVPLHPAGIRDGRPARRVSWSCVYHAALSGAGRPAATSAVRRWPPAAARGPLRASRCG